MSSFSTTQSPFINSAALLPIEIIREIFMHLLNQHKDILTSSKDKSSTCKSIYPNTGKKNQVQCMCWQLDLLCCAMVCKSWYNISLEFMHRHSSSKSSWLSLLNYEGYQRGYPFRSRLVKILQESRGLNLVLHEMVSHLVIDLASFDSMHREKVKNITVKRRVHNSVALSDMVQLLDVCSNTERLDIICDAEFKSLLPTTNGNNNKNHFLSTILTIEKQLQYNNKIKRLDLIGYNPIQRCPCCAGREWDKYLAPIIHCLPLDTLVLQHVLPSEELFKTLAAADQGSLKRVVLYKSLITLPSSQFLGGGGYNSNKGRSAAATKRRENSITRIPKKLWNQITSLAIFEEIEDAVKVWPNRGYLHNLVEYVGPQLEELVIQFDTREKNEACLSQLMSKNVYDVKDATPKPAALHALESKCSISLINVPENQ